MPSSIAHADRPPTLAGFVPPLDIARDVARRTLDQASGIDPDTAASDTIYGEFGALRETLRLLLAALDVEDRKNAPELQSGPLTMTVRVCDRATGRGHADVTVRTVTIPANCPVCGGPRGVDTVYNHHIFEDGEWYVVDRWDNPCGHDDLPADVLREARAYAQGGGRHA